MQDASEVRTLKLYYEDAYAREFDAVVLSSDRKESTADVVLDRTLFFPEEGGQSPDSGILAGFRVTDVQILDGEIHHFLKIEGGEAAEGRIPLPGDPVHGVIDWAHRFSNMQQHSGEHLFSGIVHRRFGFDNVGFHLSDREVTLDFDGVIPPEAVPEIEAEVNRAIYANGESRVLMTTPEERENMEYRSKLDLPGEVRIVVFPGVDACACCAPHVRRTGEIGILKVVGMIAYKGGVRVSILCGERALRALAEDHRIVSETANHLTTSASEILPQIVRMQEEIRGLKAAKRELAGKLLAEKARAVPAEADAALIFVEESDAKAAREVVNALAREHSFCAGVFTGDDEKGYSFVIGSAGDGAEKACAILRERFGARGGGKAGMAQGFVAASEGAIRALF